MRTAFIDCFNGAAGDMLNAAMIDAGCPLESQQQVVASLGLPGVSIDTEPVRRHGMAAVRFRVHVDGHDESHRHLPQIERIIDSSQLSPSIRGRATSVFWRLADAEAAAHGIPIEKVHFHEVGAADAIVDIVCFCAALETLRVERLVCSPLPPGSGTVNCEHGVMPVPAPATARLLQNLPLASTQEPGELVTPTGAALLAELSDEFGAMPALRLDRVGVGAGTREGVTRPNILRVMIGKAAVDTDAGLETDRIAVLEAQLDDAPGQQVAHTCERALADGALDAFIVPIIMKKGRPGQLLTVLARLEDADRLARLLLEDTTTLGVRRHEAARWKLLRRQDEVETAYGRLRVKVAGDNDRAWPEYEDCALAAERHGVSLQTVQAAALASWYAKVRG